MALTRFQIRNEYALADKDDPDALLQARSMAGLVGVLRQLGDLAEFAAEVFHCLHEKLMITAARGHGFATRLQHLEAEFPSIEIPNLSQTDHSPLFYDPGLEWHPNLQTEETLITPSNLPPCIMHLYEECRGPPQLFLLDKFDYNGYGSCFKRYSDPSLLRTRTASAVVATSKLGKYERTRKQKKKISHTTSGETPANLRTSHGKLHQLFSLEHVDKEHRDPEFHVKLKRRQLNGSLINLSCGTGYMEKFLKNSSTNCERVQGTMDQSSPAMVTEVTTCSVREDLPIPSLVYPNSADNRKYVEMEVKSIRDDERLEIPFVPQEIAVNEKFLARIEGGPATCLERSSSLNLCCKTNNDPYILHYRASAANEADSDDKDGCNLGFPGLGQIPSRTNADVTQMEEGESSLTDIQRSSPESEPHKTEGLPVNVDVSFSQTIPELDYAGMGTLELDQTSSSLPWNENPPKLPENSGSQLEHQSNKANADEIGLKSSEACEVFEGGRDSMLNISPETHPEHLLELTQVSLEVSEGVTKAILANDVEDNLFQHVVSVETGYDILVTTSVEDQFSSTSKQEIEALEPEDTSSGPGHSISDCKSRLKETPVALDSDCLLPNHYTSKSDNFEDLSRATDAHDNVVPKENETNSQDGSSMNMEQSGDISTLEISYKDGMLMLDTSRDLYTGSGNLSASSWEEDKLSNPDMAEISSYCEREDPQTMSIIVDDSSEADVPIFDTQRHGACLGGDHKNQTSVNNKDSETLPVDMEYVSVQEESLLGAEDCLVPEYCIQTHDHGQEIPSKTGSTNLISASSESLPYRVSTQDTHVGVQKSILDVSIEPMVLFTMAINPHETPQTDLEVTPSLPPLPPTQWWMGNLVKPIKAIETQFSLVAALACSEHNSFCNHGDENTQNGLVQATKQQYPSEASGENHNFHVYTEKSSVEEDVSTCAQTTLNEPSRTSEEQSLSAVNESTPKCTNETGEESSASVSLLTAEAKQEGKPAGGLEDDWRTEAMALEWFSQNLREHNNPSPLKLGEEPQCQHDRPLEPPDEIEKVGKLTREKDSLVIGIDRSMMRKVCERNENQVRPRLKEDDNLLEIIRSKSFNLRRVEASVRPNLQVAAPVTNFKVAAILEKANTLRQAMAGSDEEHDSDSWSE